MVPEHIDGFFNLCKSLITVFPAFVGYKCGKRKFFGVQDPGGFPDTGCTFFPVPVTPGRKTLYCVAIASLIISGVAV
jgi:hypothetical protein